MKLKDKVAIVTGAASGIGAASARLFAAEGARLALVDLDEVGIGQVAADIEAKGGEAITIAANVSDGERRARRRGARDGDVGPDRRADDSRRASRSAAPSMR